MYEGSSQEKQRAAMMAQGRPEQIRGQQINSGPVHQEEIQRELSRLDAMTQSLMANIDALHQKLERGGLLAPPTPETAAKPLDERPVTAMAQGLSEISGRVWNACNRVQYMTHSLGV